MGVPIPPMFAATGMERIKPILPLSFISKRPTTGATMESIMAVVAVLLMNIEKTAVINMMPNMTNLGLDPKGANSTRARFWSNRYLVAAMARKNPPRNRMMMGEANVCRMSA